MRSAGVDLVLVPMVDEFQGEYIPESAARLPYLTGFTGSAGMGVFWAMPGAERRHTLFVDGRYTLQAAQEVDASEIVIRNSGDTPFTEWLGAHTQKAMLRVGFDPWLVTMEQLTRWQKACPSLQWVATTPNLVDGIWPDRPSQPAGKVILHPLEYAGVSYEEKHASLVTTLAKHRADAVLLTQPDAINWLLNIRGDDIPFNPLLLAYFILGADGAATLYIHPHTLSAQVVEYLSAQRVSVAAIEDVFKGKVTLPKKVLIDPATTPHGIAQLAQQQGVTLIEGDDPTLLPKAKKNAAELAGMRDAHRRDGLALTRFMHWMAMRVVNKTMFNELEVIAELERFRRMDDSYRGASFATIAGAGPNGAIIHYRANEKTNRKAKLGELFLLDSGGQYISGTTDVTRTFTLGPATTAMKEHVTRVLKGHIALATAIFPKGTTGAQLDVLARQFLWHVGLDFDHGTGHGVGAYLCVHEGPQRISKRGSTVALEPGMILSNEPGFYLEGQYGIRIENLVVVVEHKNTMRAFETLTLAPIDVDLVDVAMLSTDERNWLNSYHKRVYQTHEAQLDSDARRWLERVTRAI